MKPFAKDPFSLMAFHKVFIVTAIAASLFYGFWEISRNASSEPGGAYLRASIAFGISVGLVAYLWNLRRKR